MSVIPFLDYTKESAQIVTASPAIVDYLLTLNTNNRSVRRTVVEQYKAEIAAGRWRLTNQGIGVCEDGTLTDGQHRLLAIAESGYPAVRFVLVTGLKEEARLAVDTHAKRSARDLLMFAFKARVAKQAPAICNVLIRRDNGWGSGGNHINVIHECLLEHQEQIDTVVNIPQDSAFFPAPTLAAFVVVLKESMDHLGRVTLFARRVESGEMLTAGMPELQLRNYILKTRKSGAGSAVSRERFLKSEKAVRAALAGSKMFTLRID